MKEEGKKLHLLNAKFLPDRMKFGEGGETIRREDYKYNPDLMSPLADPNLVSDQQRMTRAGTIRQGAHSVPGYNIEEVELDWLEALGHDEPRRIFPGPYSEWYQQHPLPNPKMQVEQTKLQGVKMKLDHDRWKIAVGIMADQKKIAAEIDFIRAQAAKIVADIGAERAAQQLEAFDTVMTHLTAMQEAMNERIKMTLQGPEGGQSGTDNEGRPGGSEGQQGGQGPMGVPAQAGGQPQGSVGGGALQQ
jgi:hypothetical protein